MKTYKNDFLDNIVFPLGGIGTGSIGLAGNGQLVDPEINNKPNREANFGNTGFAVKAEDDGKLVDCRMLFGNSDKDLQGTIGGVYGTNCNRGLIGFKHFEKAEFSAFFPSAKIKFTDSAFPVTVKLEAFNPFIPSNDADSSIPAAFFDIAVKNTDTRALTYTVALSMSNALEHSGLSSFSREGNVGMITMDSGVKSRSSTQYGNMTAAVCAENIAHQSYWYRGVWFDARTMFMNDFCAPGAIKERVYDKPLEKGRDTCMLTASVRLAPGKTAHIRFLISWYVPNMDYYKGTSNRKRYRNYYSTLFRSSADAARYCFANWDRLRGETLLFRDALASSTLPDTVLEAIQGNLAILKSTTCLRLEDGSFWGWEGVNRDHGSCHGTCQHVWNYAYAMPFLFPKLEKGIRSNELDHSLEESGLMHFRMNLSRESFWWDRACVDGQMGTVIKCLREWKLSGDTEWLRKYWPKIKSCIEFAWSDRNNDRWDPEKSGVITGRQHHTLDVELFGAHAWLTGFYHAALLAGAEMASALGEEDTAREYREIFKRGQKLLDKRTFNGEYYVQDLDVSDIDVLKPFFDDPENCYYWEKESGQTKYQLGDGCEIDQVLAGWHAELIGLGDVFIPEHRKKALEALYRHSFLSMHEHNNPCRVFACNGEKGLVMCTWPDGASKPSIPVPYSEECMTGFEYAAACGMLQCGMEKEALEIVSAIRERYDGKKRNPWAEMECGASYSRAMASYSFLLAYSGFRYDLSRGMIGFEPIREGSFFWSVDGAWGVAECLADRLTVKVLYGSLSLRRIVCRIKNAGSASLNGADIPLARAGNALLLTAELSAGDVLTVE